MAKARMRHSEKVLKYLARRKSPISPTEIGVKALGKDYAVASACSNYPLKKLMGEGFVERTNGGTYGITARGKMFVASL